MTYNFSEKVSHLQASAIREILKFTVDPEVISFAAGSPSPEAFPIDKISKISKEIFDDDPLLALKYGVTEGYAPLREILKSELQKKGEFNPDRDDLIITTGAQQANALIAKVLLDPNDIIACESPSFIGSLNAFRSFNAKLVGVTMEDDGVNIEELENVFKNERTKMFYIISNFQNPTGLTTSLEKRKAIYELAAKYNVVVLEDNPYGDLRFEGEDIPSIKSMDKDGVVAYSRTFSKILAPGIRVGYICGPKEIVNKMTVCKQVDDVHSTMWSQILAYRFLKEYDLNEHLAMLRPVYKRKCKIMLDEIENNFSSKIICTKPQGGLFIWCTLPEGCDMNAFCKRAVADYKVAVVPGNAFLIDESANTTSFRMNFSTPTDEQLVEGCEKIGKLSKEMFGD